MSAWTDSLRRVSIHDLNVGIPLPADLRDHAGNVLVRQGQVLDQNQLRQLGRRVLYVGPDWPSESADRQPEEDTPEEVIQALADQRGQEITTQERRKQARHDWDVKLSLEIEEEDQWQAVSRRTIEVITKDLSTGGFAFIHSQFIHPGSRVRARFDVLPHRPILSGVVRSCVKIEGVRHRVGVEFGHLNSGKRS